MLEEYHIPQEIIDIAGQHHGTTLLKYFYYKAIKEDKEKIYRRDVPLSRFKSNFEKNRQLLVLLIV